MKTKLLLKGNKDENVLSLSFEDILNFINKPDLYKWKILWFEGVWKLNDSIIDFENKIKKSETGVEYKFRELIELSRNLEQLLEITLIGDSNKDNLKRFTNDNDMYEKCQFVIELIDSSYWEFTSDDSITIDKVYEMMKNRGSVQIR
jgi:hypothetical protein